MPKSPLALIWLMGLTPVVLAILVYFSGVGQPQGRTYQGELLVQEGAAHHWQLEQTGQWQLVLVPQEACDKCLNWTQSLQQMHTALGKEKSRVSLHQVKQTQAHTRPGIYLFDPHGTLVFRYGLKQAPQQILADLKRLLKVSKIG